MMTSTYRCGMNVTGDRTQVYKLDPKFGAQALSGTAEMAIGGFLMGKQMVDLPLKLCSVSRYSEYSPIISETNF